MSVPTLVRTNRLVRTAAFAYSLLPLGVYMWNRGDGAVAWTLLLLQFVAYPQLVYWRAVRSTKPTRAELDNLFLDSALLGAWVAYLGFPLWIMYSLVGAAMLNATVNRGLTGAALSLACSALGAILTALVLRVDFTPDTTHLVSFLAAAGALAYISIVGLIVWNQNRRLAAVRDALRRSEERYRLIAENADDLVAMVDHEGRWLYTSPSYGKVFEPAELADGADALKRIHPDDAEHARMVFARAASTGKPRDIVLRLVDRQGRVRQYQCRVQPVANGTPQRVLLVSHDVTDLKESEEKMLLAAHALEGMTEAIMITAADGTIVSVNRAFSEITGRTKEEVLGQPEASIRGGLLPPEFYEEVYAAVRSQGYWSGTTWSRRKNGTVYREWRSVRAIKADAQSANPTLSHYVHVFYEVGAPKAAGGMTGTGA